MRILLTTPYDLAVPGGVNRQARDLLDALTEKGHEVRLAGPASAPVWADDPRVVRLGSVRVGALNGAKSRVTLDLDLGGPVRRLLREFRPEVLHLQEPFLPTLNSFFLRHAAGVRRVGTFHTYSETSRGYLWAWPWCRWVNAQLDARIAVSAAARDFATQYHPAEFTILPNGVRPPPESAGRAPRPCGRPVRVLFVGRADEPRKGFPVLLAAMRQLETEHPGGFVLDAVGPATARGVVDAAGLAAAYAAADVCVVPSLGGESFGLVALEALAHGLPVVATRIRGYAEWLEEAGVGPLVPAGDGPALAAAIRGFTQEAGGYQTAIRRTRGVASQHAWDALLPRLLEIYRGA